VALSVSGPPKPGYDVPCKGPLISPAPLIPGLGTMFSEGLGRGFKICMYIQIQVQSQMTLIDIWTKPNINHLEKIRPKPNKRRNRSSKKERALNQLGDGRATKV